MEKLLERNGKEAEKEEEKVEGETTADKEKEKEEGKDVENKAAEPEEVGAGSKCPS